ncbi:tyrosine recombinase XerS, partial [Streptococcus suis]
KDRDLAFLALLLDSGVRLSEAVNLYVRDVNLNMIIIEVTRKGVKRDSVNEDGFANTNIEAYMVIRQQRKNAEKTDTAF